jgi:tRNA nucleotidyltransferase/poly(A) polymerase
MSRKAGPQSARAAAVAILSTLRRSGHTAYLAGGCVRDELLGLAPTDYDIATDATPDRIKSLFKRTNEVGAAFGVVLITLGPSEGIPEPATVEVATFRSEGPYTDRRRPDAVTFSDPRSDALRRDFTINALFLDPISPPAPRAPISSASQVIDFVGGRDDLARKLIRAVGDPAARLAEDHLRALRAVRLAARLGFEIDPATAAAIRDHARALVGVSRERIGDELRKMLAHPSRARAVALLQDLGLDSPLLTEPPAQPAPRILAGLPEAPSYPACLAAWALDRGHPAQANPADLVSRYRHALSLSNDESDGLRNTLSALTRLPGWSQLPIAAQKRLAGLTPGYPEALALYRSIDPGAAEAVASRTRELAASPPGLAPEPLLTGDHLVAAGMTPGPGFKTILDAVYDAQLEGRIGTREQALELARTLRI